MNTVLISGSSGFVGSALKLELKKLNFQIRTLVRRKPQNDFEFFWDPKRNNIDLNAFKNCDFVVNLSGENIFGLWTKSKKERILKSRVLTTKLLVDSINSLENKPKKIISTSAIGIYKPNTKLVLNEDSEIADNFLANVCKSWENEITKSTVPYSILRVPLVLGKGGGMIKFSYPFFKNYLGANIGNGKNYYSYINIDSLVSLYIKSFKEDFPQIFNPVNGYTDSNTFNKEYVKKLNSKIFFRVPKFIPSLFLGKEFVNSILVPDLKITSKFAYNENIKISNCFNFLN